MKITLTLISINIIAFVLSLANFNPIIENYGFSVNNLLSGHVETLVTSMFLHGSFLHLAGNMVALLFLGGAIESKVKGWQYLLVYFLAGILGNLSFFIPLFGFDYSTIGIGASAAISGLVGLGTFVSPGKLTMFPIIIPIPFVIAGALFLMLTSAMLFSTEGQVAYPAHFVGIITGAIFGFLWTKHRIRNSIIFIILVLLITIFPFVLQVVFG